MYLPLGTCMMKRRIISPINRLAVTAEEYIKRDKTVEDDARLFFQELKIDTNDEIETLYHALAEMELDINSTMRRIREMTAEKERAAAEMNLAARIQSSMLPTVFPLFPGKEEFDVFASMDPAKEVEGDFYDAFLIDDDHLCLVIADVSGKGVPASLFMVVSRTVIKNRAKLEEHRMFELIKEHRDDDIVTLLKNIRSDVDDFVKDAPQYDDLTMMVVEYKTKICN